MLSTDRLVNLLLLLVTVMLIGMLTGSWRIVLYPYLVVVGVILLLGVGSARARDPIYLRFAICVTAIYFGLYIWLDFVIDADVSANTPLIGGVIPSTAIYFYLIWPMGLIVAVMYALFHRRLMADEGPGDADSPKNVSTQIADEDSV